MRYGICVSCTSRTPMECSYCMVVVLCAAMIVAAVFIYVCSLAGLALMYAFFTEVYIHCIYLHALRHTQANKHTQC